MRSRMHPKYYLSQEIFERERAKIFQKVWLFAGLASMVPDHNSFLTRIVAGVPVVIQNFRGELRAFENVCLHRSAPLQQGVMGTRPLVCAYHAWSYGSEGEVKHIPDCETIYQFKEHERCSLRLRQFSLKKVGALLFINLNSEAMPFEEQFSPEFVDLMRSSSQAYDTEVMMTTWHANFNWKLVYENLRDANHVKYLHSKSLAKVASFPFSPGQNEDTVEDALDDLSVTGLRTEMHKFSYGGPEGEIEPVHKLPWMSKVQRWGNVDAYYNWLAYPNLHIACGNGGYSFTIENHVPVSPSRTDVEIYFLTARKKNPYDFSAQVLLSHMHYSKKILTEDISMLEGIQSVLYYGAPIPTQGIYEKTNRKIERWYTTLMETDYEV